MDILLFVLPLFLSGCVDKEEAVQRNHLEFMPWHSEIEVLIYDSDSSIYLAKVNRASAPELDREWYLERLEGHYTVDTNTTSVITAHQGEGYSVKYVRLGFADPEWIIFLHGTIEGAVEKRQFDYMTGEFDKHNTKTNAREAQVKVTSDFIPAHPTRWTLHWSQPKVATAAPFSLKDYDSLCT